MVDGQMKENQVCYSKYLMLLSGWHGGAIGRAPIGHGFESCLGTIAQWL